MKKILFICELLLLMRLVYHIVITIWYLKKEVREDIELNYDVTSYVFNGLYFVDRMSLIILYRFLLIIKYAQMTIDTENKTTE